MKISDATPQQLAIIRTLVREHISDLKGIGAPVPEIDTCRQILLAISDAVFEVTSLAASSAGYTNREGDVEAYVNDIVAVLRMAINDREVGQ